MTEPTGYEYVLESTQQRTTSLVVRKAPNLCTLVQKTPTGVVMVDLSEEAKGKLANVLFPAPILYNVSEEDLRNLTEASRYGAIGTIVANSSLLGTNKRKPGRPPKSSGEAA